MTPTNYFMPTSWREKAAAVTATNDQDIEKAFSDQASGFVENQVGDLMKDEHRVGFEIVKKNDDNTRMVGIFCFRVGDDIIYAPVFFLNGEIKGPLLYRSTTKTFVPANKEWANYLIESMEKGDGRGHDRQQRAHTAPLVRMRDIAFLPPGMGKRAAKEAPESKAPIVGTDTVPAPGKNTDSSKHVYDQKEAKNKPSESADAIFSLLPGGTQVINVPAKWERIEAPCGCATGEFEIDLKPQKGQPELTTGETTVKIANWDDGTVRMEMADRWEPLTQEDGNEIKSAAWTGKATIVLDTPSIKLTFDKEAAAKIQAFIDAPSNRTEKTLDACFEKASQFMDGKGLIAEFLQEADYGEPASNAIFKAASNHFPFAEQLATIYGSPENLVPKCFNRSVKKQAAASGELAMYFDAEALRADVKDDKAMAEFFKSGAYMSDMREKDALAVVWDLNPSDIQAPEDPGEYALLNQTGGFLEGAVVVPAYVGIVGNVAKRESGEYAPYRSDYMDSYQKPVYHIIHDGKVITTNEAFGMMTKPLGSSSKLVEKPTQGKMYYVYTHGTKTAFGPVYFDEIKQVDGVLRCSCFYKTDQYFASPMAYKPYHPQVLVVNQDVEASDIGEGVLGADAKFIQVDFNKKDRGEDYVAKTLDTVGRGKNLDDWIFKSHGVSKAEVERRQNIDKEASFRIGDGTRKSPWMHKRAMLLKLSHELSVPGEQAYDVVERAEKEGSYSFYIQHPMEKTSSHLVLADRPNLDDTFDTEFGIPLEPVKKFVLRVHGDQLQPTPSAIGDAYDPATPTGLPDLTVATTEPEDLQTLADVYHLPNVFEHGVVGTLANTFNATYLVDKYVGKIEDAVDVLGRIKFLLYWCPSDFEKAYGTDDVANFEAEIDSNYDSLGACLLKLLKRSDKQRNGKKQDSEKAQ